LLWIWQQHLVAFLFLLFFVVSVVLIVRRLVIIVVNVFIHGGIIVFLASTFASSLFVLFLLSSLLCFFAALFMSHVIECFEMVTHFGSMTLITNLLHDLQLLAVPRRTHKGWIAIFCWLGALQRGQTTTPRNNNRTVSPSNSHPVVVGGGR
jgi:hypothetical protein